jgi:hypothetical protein
MCCTTSPNPFSVLALSNLLMDNIMEDLAYKYARDQKYSWYDN